LPNWPCYKSRAARKRAAWAVERRASTGRFNQGTLRDVSLEIAP
jgi:hypothetical protein